VGYGDALLLAFGFSLQRAFLEVLSDFPKHQYFITSHSNHLLDMTSDYSNISIFHFMKAEGTQPPTAVRAASSRDHRLLFDLGVRNSSVFLTNATIWVEGITDRLYLRVYLEKYIQELKRRNVERADQLSILKEDYHYSFVEYQGSTLTHWSFDPEDQDAARIKATYVCGHAFLIADGDVATKRDREAVYHDMLGDRFFILNVKEIENLMPEAVLRRVAARKCERHGKDVDLIRQEEYSIPETPIGTYLDSLLDLPRGTTVFADKSGTIKMKVPFCEEAVEVMTSSELDWLLTPDLTELCERIFDHILSQNREQGLRV